MRSMILAAAIAFAVLLIVQFLVPSSKELLNTALTAASGVSIGIVGARRVPIYCRCSECGKKTYRVRYDIFGHTITCRECHEHVIYVPHLTVLQIVKQQFGRFILRKDLADIAI